MKNWAFLYSTKLTEIQKYVIPIGSPSQTTGPGNDLGVSDIMSSGHFIGYFGMNNNWKNNTEATWDFMDNRMQYAYEVLYSKVYQPWVQIYKNLKDSEDITDQHCNYAFFNIINVAGWLRATDVFGPIVYTNAGRRIFSSELG